MGENNRIAITITTKSYEEQVKIGEQICNQLVGNPDYIDNNIIVNYTDSISNNVYVVIGNEAKETILNLTI